MRRLVAWFWLAASAGLVWGCETTEPGAGSNTNWLRPCDEDAPCGDALSCVCGVCTAPCDEACSELPNAVCAQAESAVVRELCGELPLDGATGICLPACSVDAPCEPGQLCLDGTCLQLATVDDSASGCVAGAQLQIGTGGVELEARYGTVFGSGLYLPVAYDERPVDWVELTDPAPIVVFVTNQGGARLADCPVRFVTGEGSGLAFANRPDGDNDGTLYAYWVAGNRREQTLTATLVDQKGVVRSLSVSGTAYANDEGPQAADDAATVATRPATVQLGYALPDTSNGLRVVVSPSTYPHHAFYSVVNIDGFFAGLQNTSDLDASIDDVPDADRVLIASVWNLAEGDAQQLYGMDGLDCGPHDQDLGGIRCTLAGAWQPEQAYVFQLERTTLATGEAGPDYEALGYLTEPCASAAGCTDYTLWFGTPEAPDELQRVVAYRYQSGELAGSFGSFIQPYSDLPEQNSCLATPAYDALFLPFVQNGDVYEPVLEADFSAAYLSWHNEICANYAADPEAGGFHLVTGGAEPLGRPVLLGETARLLTLPQ
ncbi:MAG TPA: hypothetical protein VHP33_34385 [Polyangiaceae bacterium]|nr:hypothetical protein [Polyangiaceae bacterium]